MKAFKFAPSLVMEVMEVEVLLYDDLMQVHCAFKSIHPCKKAQGQ